MTQYVPGPIVTRKVAILVKEGLDGAGASAMVAALAAKGARGLLVGPVVGEIADDVGAAHHAPFSILTTSSVLFDAVYVPGGEGAAQWALESDALEFVKDAYKHCKQICATGEGVALLTAAGIPVGAKNDADPADDATIVGARLTAKVVNRFIDAMGRHRLWSREVELHLPL
jgi:catalase